MKRTIIPPSVEEEKIEEEIVEEIDTSPCGKCGLYTQCSSPKFNYSGDGEKGILFVIGQPSKEADIAGELGTGKHWDFLKKELKQLDISLEKDCYYTSAVNCRPLGGKEPSVHAVKICHDRLIKLINRLDPKIIIPMGDIAFRSLIGYKMKGRINGTPWTSFIGDVIPDQEYKRHIMPLNDVGYLFSRKKWDNGDWSKMLYEREPATYLIWQKNLAKAMDHAVDFYTSNYIGDCLYTEDTIQAQEWVKEAMSWDMLAFDYETTGIKPHMEGHAIWTASISNGMFSFAFPFFEDKEFRRAWKRLMLSDVKKIAHNIQFENIWTHAQLGYYVANWFWDTMLVAHNIHNLKPTGLKYLVYANFGDMAYDSEADAYLCATEKDKELYGDNAINRIREADMKHILPYNALDSLYTYKLYEKQETLLKTFQREGNAFFLESAITLSMATENGIRVDHDILAKNKKDIDDQMTDIEARIATLPDVLQWDGEEPFNFNSTKQLGHLLFDVLKFKPLNHTPGGRPSVDKETLPEYNTPVVEAILEYRSLSKIKDYLKTYEVEAVNGLVHPFYNINRVDTFRSSSSSPNVQNIPKRNKEAKKIIRDALVPRQGNRIIEYDYKSLEVMISACNNLDPTLIKYVTDPSSDMHYDSAAECFILPRDKVTKDMRQDIKGHFVFAEFYGSYYAQVAKDLWEDVQKHGLKDHMKKQGIDTYDEFESHIQKVERFFWDERFPKYDKWRKDQYKFYQTHGYVDLLTGFRASGPMSKNNTFNTPVQGSAYHVLQWTMNRVMEKVDSECERSYIVGEIHDALVADVHPSEEALVDGWVKHYGTVAVREAFPWIIVPLVIEKERSEIDGSWSVMTAYHNW